MSEATCSWWSMGVAQMPKIDGRSHLERHLFSAWAGGRAAEIFLYDDWRWVGYSPWVPTRSVTQQAEGTRGSVQPRGKAGKGD